MASGDPVVLLLEAMPPAANPATLGFRAGGSTPAERNRLWEFDHTTGEYMDYRAVLHGYGGGGLTFRIKWSADGTASGNVVWRIAIRAIPDDTEDTDSSHSYDYNSVTDAAPTVDGEVAYATITFTNGTDMDSWADGELGIVRIGRDAGNASDTMNSNDAQLWALTGEET